MSNARERIVDVAFAVLGQNPDAGMGDIASAAGVVRRTVYGHFPSRSDLLLALTERGVSEMVFLLAEVAAAHEAADETWADFIARLWPLTHRYRVLIALRRGEYGKAIHSLLEPVEKNLADLVARGQFSGVFGQHLPAHILSQVAFAGVFVVADNDSSQGPLGVRAATTTSLLTLGVPRTRAKCLAKTWA